MTEQSTVVDSNLLELTAEIVAAYVANNLVQCSGMSELIATVHSAVEGLNKPAAVTEVLVPAVNPKRSIHPDYIVCLEDGKRFKSLKRHSPSWG